MAATVARAKRVPARRPEQAAAASREAHAVRVAAVQGAKPHAAGLEERVQQSFPARSAVRRQVEGLRLPAAAGLSLAQDPSAPRRDERDGRRPGIAAPAFAARCRDSAPGASRVGRFHQVTRIRLPALHRVADPPRGERGHGRRTPGPPPGSPAVRRADQDRRTLGAGRRRPDPGPASTRSGNDRDVGHARSPPPGRPRLPAVGRRGDITVETTGRPVDHERGEPVIPVPERDRRGHGLATRPGLRGAAHREHESEHGDSSQLHKAEYERESPRRGNQSLPAAAR